MNMNPVDIRIRDAQPADVARICQIGNAMPELEVLAGAENRRPAW